jgi:hypothetical protein
MGDPHSPGMTIGTCAWMEHEWMQTLGENVKEHFRAKRYMDDVLLIYADNPSINFDIFLKDFKQSECYLPPLKLEEAGDCTFLETTFEVTKDNNIKYWLKNTNEIGAPTKIWRYAHFDSYMPFAMKKAIMLACLKKVGKMASNNEALYNTAVQKVHEYLKLKYPPKMIWTACTTIGVHTRNPIWFDIRDYIQYKN